jgi:ABC-type protease/lipase transport system fused ATPase/permease subunit
MKTTALYITDMYIMDVYNRSPKESSMQTLLYTLVCLGVLLLDVVGIDALFNIIIQFS